MRYFKEMVLFQAAYNHKKSLMKIIELQLENLEWVEKTKLPRIQEEDADSSISVSDSELEDLTILSEGNA